MKNVEDWGAWRRRSRAFLEGFCAGCHAAPLEHEYFRVRLAETDHMTAQEWLRGVRAVREGEFNA